MVVITILFSIFKMEIVLLDRNWQKLQNEETFCGIVKNLTGINIQSFFIFRFR